MLSLLQSDGSTLGLLRGAQPVDTCPTNSEFLCDCGCTHTAITQFLDLLHINRRLAVLVNAFCLGLGNTFHLPFFAKVCLELCENKQHIKKTLGRYVFCGNGLLGCRTCATLSFRGYKQSCAGRTIWNWRPRWEP